MREKMALAAIPAALILATNAWADETTMSTVVVTANRTQELKRELSGNVTIIDEAGIKASPAATMADLMAQNGLLVVTTGSTSNVQIRGYGSLTMSRESENTVLTLINGHRVGNSNLATMGLANVERVEIIRGPSAVQYGSSALGGVINIITKRGTGKPYASIEAGGGSDGLVRGQAALGGSFGNFDLSLGLSKFARGDLTTADAGRWYHSDIDDNTTANFDLGYTIAKNHRIGLSHYQGSVEYNLPSNGGIRPYSQNIPSAFYDSFHKKYRDTVFSYTGHTGDKAFDWSASYSDGRTDDKYPSYGYTDFLETRMFNAQAGYNGEMVSLSLGADSLRYRHYEDRAPEKSDMLDHGVYFSGKLRLLDERLILSLGGRYDRYKNKSVDGQNYSDNHFGSSYGVAWLPVDGLKLRANYAEGFKMPSTRQVGGSSPWYNANPNLKPEESDTWEIGADLEWRALTASLTYFHSDYKNKIVGMWVSGMPRDFQFQNLKTATLAGVEGNLRADLGKAFGKSWSLSPYVGFTWLGTRKNGDSTQFVNYNGSTINTLPNTPEWMFSYGVDFSHPGYKLKSRINAVTYGTLLTRDWSRSGAPYFERSAGTVVDLSLDKELLAFSSGTLTLRAEVNNLFDGKNEMYWGYPGAGRSFYAGLRYDYK